MRDEIEEATRAPSTSHRLWKRLRTVLGVLLSAAGCYYVAHTLLNASSALDLSAQDISAGWLVCSVALTAVSSLMGGAMWRYLLLGFGYDVPLARCTLIQTSAALLKYIPGFVWQPLGKAHLTEESGVPLRVTGAVVLVEYAALIGSGLLLVGWLLPDSTIEHIVPMSPALARAIYCVGTSAVLIGCFAATGPIGKLLARITRIREFHGLRRKPLALALLVALVAWLLLSAGLGACGRSLGTMSLHQWQLAAAALPSGMIAGLVVIVAPAGLGIRESLMLLMLGAGWPSALAALIATTSRLVFVVAEVLAWGIVQLYGIATRHNASITRKD